MLNWLRRAPPPPAQRTEPVLVQAAKRRPSPVSLDALAHARVSKRPLEHPFRMPDVAPGVLPAGQKLAMDNAVGSPMSWAAGIVGSGGYEEGLGFLGYPYLAELAQRPEYRQISETIARCMTRHWIKLKSKSGEDKSKRIAQIEEGMRRLGVQQSWFKTNAHDGLFGRGHLYIDLGNDNPAELATPIGDGWNAMSGAKVKKGSLKAIRPVEPVWCYPTGYNSTNPLAADFYNPGAWYVMGTKVDASRLLRFVGREVPDLLKPAYSFGGLSLSQMMKKDVDFWLRDQRSVSDIVNAFSVFVLMTDVTASLAATGDELYRRAQVFNDYRDNSGLLLVDKLNEDFKNVSAPLGTLDQLRAQSQETLASISGIPLVELLGVQPAGLNASSDGEMATFAGRIHAANEGTRPQLRSVLGFVMLNEFGEVDEDIDFDFNPTYELDEKEIREKQFAEAQTDQILVDSGIVSVEESRKALAGDPDSRYAGIDVDDLPVPKPGETDDEPPEPKRAPEDDGVAADADFKESEHPRDRDGKFGSGGGGSMASGQAGKATRAQMAQTMVRDGKRLSATGGPLPPHVE